MARIAGVDLPRDRKVEYALPVIFGIGHSAARKILQATGVDPNKRVRDLTDEEVAKLRAEIENNYTIEGPAPRAADEHPTPHRNRLLSRHSPPTRVARARATHPHQRAHP